MSIFKILIVTFSLFLLGCGDGSPTSSEISFVEGTYSLTALAQYENSDCSGTARTGICDDNISTTEAECEASEGNWMLLVELFTFPEAMEFVLSDGIANAPQGDDGTNTGTYTVDGTVITIIDDEDSEIITLTINADGTLTMDNSNSGGCFDDEGNEVEGASDDTCSGNWAQPSCFAMIFNLVAS